MVDCGSARPAFLALVAAAMLAGVAAPAAHGAPGFAITPGEEVPATAEPAPLTISFESALNFDRLLTNGNGPGSARLDPSGEHDVAGSIESIGGRAVVGRMVIEGEPNREIAVDFPETIELIGMSGESILIRKVFTNLTDMPALDSTGRLEVLIGGEVTIDGDVDGDFRGNLLVRANYL